MPRPTTKTELIVSANDQWNKMWELIDSVHGGAQSVVFSFDDPKLKEAHWLRDKNMRDVLIHLYEWHRLLLDWTSANFAGEPKPFLPEPYTWKTYGDMNMEFLEKHRSTPYENAKAMLCESTFTSFNFIGIVALSMIFSISFLKSKNLLVPITMHMLYDLMMFVLLPQVS